MTPPDPSWSADEFVGREYETTERVAMRRLDRTGWLRGDDPWLVALEQIAMARPDDVLDAGSGSGEFSSLIAARNVVCVDSSQAAISAASKRGLSVQVGDVRALPFRDAAFDVVVSNWVLYHVPDRARAISEMWRVLRPGGRFIGCYNAPRHLAELWSAVAVTPANDDFNSENGPGELEAVFATARAIPADGQVLWATRDDLQICLDAYVEFHGPLQAPAGPYPFVASRRNAVLVAEKT
jgi:SAM-dependent methyltransferase